MKTLLWKAKRIFITRYPLNQRFQTRNHNFDKCQSIAPLGTVLTRAAAPGAHLTLVGTFVSEDPSASSVLVKNTTTGHHHWLSVGEGVGDFHVLRIEAKQVVSYHQGTEVTLHLPDAVFLETKRR